MTTTFDALKIRYFPLILVSGWTWGLSRWGVSFVGPFIVNELTGSARMVQLAGVALWSPLLFGGVVGGWISDRFDRRRVVISQFFVTIPGLILLGWIELAGELRLWMVYPVLFVTGIGWVFDMVGRRVIVYDLVGPENIDNALALEASGGAIALALGAVGGGTLIQTFGVGWALIVMGALQIVSFSAFAAVPVIARMEQVATAGVSALLDGVRMLRTEKSLVSILGVTAFVNFFFFSSSPLLQVVGGKFDVGPALLGLLAAMLGIGMFGGSLAMARYQPQRRGLMYVCGSYLAFLFMIGFALAPWYLASAVFLVVAASGMGLFASTQAVLVMDSVPEERRGRALGLLSSAIGVLPIGMLALGEIAELVGTSLAITIPVITGAVLMTIFLRIRPETLYLSQNTGEEEVSTKEDPPRSRGLPPTVFNLKPV
ncbi:MAG: MFS transporter [Actinomycetota bacterium]|nr:MFS transporter [Actinomycetota bacterium]